MHACRFKTLIPPPTLSLPPLHSLTATSTPTTLLPSPATGKPHTTISKPPKPPHGLPLIRPNITGAMSTLFFLLILLLAGAGDGANTKSEIAALVDFKSGLHDPLGALSGWLPTSAAAPCDWSGVTCTISGDVSDVSLPHLQLSGGLSSSLASLTSLRRLSLPSNSLNGSLPSFLSNVTSLHFLNLAGNSFTGPIFAGDLPPNLKFLDLSSNSLSGELSPSLSNLSNLQLLNLSYNHLAGGIPASLGLLQNLQYLSLDYNRLYGTLPAAISNCSSLIHLSAEGNQIAGVLPAAIPNLPKIQVISLSRNNLSGFLPSSLFCNDTGTSPSLRIVRLGFNDFTGVDNVDSSADECSSVLQELDLQQNRIRSSMILARLGNAASETLTLLDVSRNFISGSIPAEIGNLVRLIELRLADNSLIGDLPVELMNCSSLQVLDLEGNQISGEIPPFLGDMKGLKTLSLSSNRFKGSLPSNFGNLYQLQALDLSDNGVSGNFPAELTSLTNLTALNLAGNNFSGQIPDSIGKLNRLVFLSLSGNKFNGEIPKSFGNLYKLTVLDLSGQNLSGEVPSEISGLPNLEDLALQDNSFTGDVPVGFSSLLSLTYLNLSSNRFSGEIPPTFGFLRNLNMLSLSNNNIGGSIPPELGNCSSLEVLELRHDSLTGNFPPDLSRLSRLIRIDLGQNRLSGEIPHEISQCSSLSFLLMDDNHISGIIPSSLSNLSSLTALDLSMNDLGGSIPTELMALSHLTYFNVSHNRLEGEIPSVLGSRFRDPSIYAKNGGLCGPPTGRDCENSEKSDGRRRLVWLLVIAIGGSCLLILCCCFYTVSLLRWRKRLQQGEKKRSSPSRASSGGGSAGRGSNESNGAPKLVMFNNKITLAETVEATRSFDEENVLSRTRYGLVFKASYADGMVLAVRRLADGLLDENAFRKEAEALGKVRHRNLVVLRGYYAGPPDLRLLVYDYMPNGNLATLLQEASHQDGHVLNWPMRHLIALGIAKGLAFLHTSQVVHGDIKPQSVLFDADFEAHLSDFGLDRLVMAGPTEPSGSASVGTLGYVSPEAAVAGVAAKESDVYSFGIVLLELLTGKRPLMFTQDEDIVKWVKRQLQKGQISELLEPGLLELDPESSEWEEFLLGIKVGLLCTAPDPMDRPSMADIVFMLEGCRVGPDIPSSADPTSHHSPA